MAYIHVSYGTCFEQALYSAQTCRVQNTVVVAQLAKPTRCTMSTTMLKRNLGTGDLCDNIGLVGVSAKWSYVTPILSPLHVGHPYIPLFKIRRIFDLLVSIYMHAC